MSYLLTVLDRDDGDPEIVEYAEVEEMTIDIQKRLQNILKLMDRGAKWIGDAYDEIEDLINDMD